MAVHATLWPRSGDLWRHLPPADAQGSRGALIRDLQAFAEKGAGEWHLIEVHLPAIEQLTRARSSGPLANHSEALFDAIDAQVQRACESLSRPWSTAALAHLGFAEGTNGLSRTRREEKAAACLRVSPRTYRRKNNAKATGGYDSWALAVLAHVADAVISPPPRLIVPPILQPPGTHFAVTSSPPTRTSPLSPFSSYAARYLSLPFPDLIEHLSDIESDLIGDLISTILATIAETATEIRGDVIMFEHCPARIAVTAAAGDRTLIITISPLADASRVSPLTASLSEFGVLRTLRIFAPPQMRDFADSLLARCTALIRSAYIALESAYITSYRDWRAKLHNTLYEIVNIQLRLEGRDALLGRYWFSITNLATTTFHYQFGDDVLRRAISWLKTHPSAALSPCSAATLLIIHEVLDGVFGAGMPSTVVSQTPDYAVLQFEALPTLGTNTDYWIAERALYGSEALAAIDVARVLNYVLQANCPVASGTELQAALEPVRSDLQLVFTREHDAYLRDHRRLEKALFSLRASKAVWLRELGDDTIAKTITAALGETANNPSNRRSFKK
jgi:hypothetical protein